MAALLRRHLEPLFIAVFMSVLVAIGIEWPGQLLPGRFILYLALAFLLQTLLRDLFLLHKQRRTRADLRCRQCPCFCLESAVGVVALLIGCMMLFAGAGQVVNLTAAHWHFYLLLTLLSGYFLRDFVFSWRPFRIFRDPGHINIIPSWR